MNEELVLKEFKTVMTVRPNCTAYLVWHYLKNKKYHLALAEFQRDGDKIPSFCFVRGRREILASLVALAEMDDCLITAVRNFEEEVREEQA